MVEKLGLGSWWWVFLILAFLPLLIRFLPGRSKKDEFIYITSLPKILESEPKNKVYMIFGFAYSAWIFLMIALMRPVYHDTPIVIEQPHRDIILALDLSDSMEIMDMLDREGHALRRIDVVKDQVREFILSRIRTNSNDRIGIILFSDQAHVLSPLTYDKGLLLNLTEEIDPKLASGPLTNISAAINMAISRFEEAGTNKKILILLTDGKNTVEGMTPAQAANNAANHDMKIYTIGFGSDTSTEDFDDDDNLSDGSAEIDENTLQAIAKITHGNYYRARDSKSLHNRYQEINFNETSEESPLSFQPDIELYQFPLLLSLLLSVATGVIVRRTNG